MSKPKLLSGSNVGKSVPLTKEIVKVVFAQAEWLGKCQAKERIRALTKRK